MSPQQPDDLLWIGSTFGLVLRLGRDPECLAHVLLVDPVQRSATPYPVVSLDDDGALGSERLDPGPRRGQVDGPSGREAQVFVEVMVIEVDHRRLQDMRRGDGAAGHAPSSSLCVAMQGCLRLGAGEAELTAVLNV